MRGLTRHVLIVAVLLVACAGLARAQNDEATFSFSHVKPEDSGSITTFTGQYGIAVGQFRLGPAISLIDGPGYDSTLVGAIAEVNFGKKAVAFSLGARILYDNDAEEGYDDIQTTALAAFKFFMGDRAFARFEGGQIVSGFGENSDLTVTGGFGVRF